MALVEIEDKVLSPVDAGLLGAVGIMLEPYCIPSTISGQARTRSSSFFGRCVMRIAENPHLLKARKRGTMVNRFAEKPRREYHTEEAFLNVRTMGASVERLRIHVARSRHMNP
jgi:hypothetical protein